TEGQEVVASELKPALTRLLLEDRLHESLRRIGVRRTLENDEVSGTEMLRNCSRGRLDVGCVRIFRSGHGRRYADEKDVDVVGLREVVVCDKRFGLDDIAKLIVIDVVDQILPGVQPEHSFGVQVDTDGFEPALGKFDSEGQTLVAETYHADIGRFRSDLLRQFASSSGNL